MKKTIGILGWLGIALVVAALAVKFVPSLADRFGQWAQPLALAGLVVTALYALTQWRDIGRSFQGRTCSGSIAIGSVAMFLTVLIGINWIASRQNKRWDWTEAQPVLDVGPDEAIAEADEKPVKIHVFHATSQNPDQRTGSTNTATGPRITADHVDAGGVRRKYGITQVPTVILEYGGRTERTSNTDEQGLTNALKKVVEGKAKKVYFVQGHGEKDPTSTETIGYKTAAEALVQDNFETAKLALPQEGKIPDDASVLVIAGPTSDFFPPELEALKAYLKRGGKVLLMIDPPGKTATAAPASLIAFAKQWAIDIGNDIVVDASGMGRMIGTDASIPLAVPAPHAITRDIRTVTGFPIARSVTPIEGGADGKFAQKLAETSQQSWAEADIKGLYETLKPTRDTTKGDRTGPISLAAAVSAPAPDAPASDGGPEAQKPETRLVVVGDSDFATNGYMALGANKDLFLNMANWLAQQENLISIRPKDPADRRIQMTASQGTMLYWLTMAIIPAALFGTAIRVYWKRR